VLHGRGEPERSADQVDRAPDCEVMRARFEAIALPHLDAVYRLARALAGSDAEAEDLVQETFVRAFQGFGGFELRSYGAKPWLFRILHNTFYTVRGRQRRAPITLDPSDMDRAADTSTSDNRTEPGLETLNWEHFDQEIKTAVDGLPADYRSVLLLWSIEGYSYKEIAEICGCALGTVMSRLYRARRLMAVQLRNYARERKWSTERYD